MARLDLYKECNDQPNVTLEDFRLAFCVRCVNPECTRSQAGKSKFDQRVATWESRLFHEVPRMSPQDPRFEAIRSKNFLDIDRGRPHEVQGWVDPRDLEVPPESDRTYEVPKATQIKSDALADLAEAEASRVEEVQAPAKNTPNRRGQMVGGEKIAPKPIKPVSDPWEVKKPPKGKVVRPGAKIRLGGSKPV